MQIHEKLISIGGIQMIMAELGSKSFFTGVTLPLFDFY